MSSAQSTIPPIRVVADTILRNTVDTAPAAVVAQTEELRRHLDGVGLDSSDPNAWLAILAAMQYLLWRVPSLSLDDEAASELAGSYANVAELTARLAGDVR